LLGVYIPCSRLTELAGVVRLPSPNRAITLPPFFHQVRTRSQTRTAVYLACRGILLHPCVSPGLLACSNATSFHNVYYTSNQRPPRRFHLHRGRCRVQRSDRFQGLS
jgi:hypothetical protein